jgi:hypothetical protein
VHGVQSCRSPRADCVRPREAGCRVRSSPRSPARHRGLG